MQTKNSAFKNDHQSLGIFTQQPKYKLFADLSNRLNSFSKGFFGGPDTTEVAKAGFYHTGTDDIVQCFYCGLKLRNWTPSDNPWIEHARHGEHCPFVKNVKGRDFCQTVITKYDKDIEADSASSRCLYTDDLIFTTAAQALLNMKCYTREDITKAIKSYVARHGRQISSLHDLIGIQCILHLRNNAVNEQFIGVTLICDFLAYMTY